MKSVLDTRIVLAIALSAAKTVESFNIPARRRAATTSPTATTTAAATIKATSLFAGFYATGDYLSDLSGEFTVERSRALSSTEEYLKSLTQFVDYTTNAGASWEQHAGQHAVESSNFAVAADVSGIVALTADVRADSAASDVAHAAHAHAPLVDALSGETAHSATSVTDAAAGIGNPADDAFLFGSRPADASLFEALPVDSADISRFERLPEETASILMGASFDAGSNPTNGFLFGSRPADASRFFEPSLPEEAGHNVVVDASSPEPTNGFLFGNRPADASVFGIRPEDSANAVIADPRNSADAPSFQVDPVDAPRFEARPEETLNKVLADARNSADTPVFQADPANAPRLQARPEETVNNMLADARNSADAPVLKADPVDMPRFEARPGEAANKVLADARNNADSPFIQADAANAPRFEPSESMGDAFEGGASVVAPAFETNHVDAPRFDAAPGEIAGDALAGAEHSAGASTLNSLPETAHKSLAVVNSADGSFLGSKPADAASVFRSLPDELASNALTNANSADASLLQALPKGVVPPEASVGDSPGPSLLRELSTMSYDSLQGNAPGASNNAAKTIAELASSSPSAEVDSLIVDSPVSKAPQPPVDLSSFSFDLDMGKVSEQVAEFPSKASTSLDTAARTLARAVALARDSSTAEMSKSLESLQAGRAQLMERGAETMQGAGELQVEELGNSMVAGLQKVGSLFLEALNASVDAVCGTSLSEILASAQLSANALVDGAIQQVINTINHIGDMTVLQVLQFLVTIIVTVTSTLWKIFNAVVGTVSGKSALEWGLTVSQALEHDANQLTAKVAAAATDFSEKSLSELVVLSASFLHDTTDLLAQGLQGISASLAVSDSMGDVASTSVDVLSGLIF